MKEMRRKERSITVAESYEILSKGEYGFLSTISLDSTPYTIPLNYCNGPETIYFHCAAEGEKLDNLRNNASVTFSVVGHTQVLPDSFGTLYESVIVRGKALEVSGRVKQAALESIIEKYSSEYRESGLKYIDAMIDKTVVVAISIDSISGKARRE